jgi:hypothetical protein
MDEVIVMMGNVYQWELPAKKLKAEVELDELVKVIKGRTFNHEVEGDQRVGGQAGMEKEGTYFTLCTLVKDTYH